MPQCDDSQRSRNRSSKEKVLKRSDELKDGGMPQCDDPQRSKNRSNSEKVRKRSDELKDGENLVSHGLEDAYCEHGNSDDAMKKNRIDDKMYNDDAKRVSNPKIRLLSEYEDDDEAWNTRTSNDPLKSNMKGGHVNNEHSDGMNNDPKLLREGHSSHAQNGPYPGAEGEQGYKKEKAMMLMRGSKD
uniref:Uncharacterized protein n=1 Tax=Vitis vinifera TaxID=29760 RepID=A5BZ77_VITVI|nr:hypothetical protein VITISV_038965 [Vitis vinifera]